MATARTLTEKKEEKLYEDVEIPSSYFIDSDEEDGIEVEDEYKHPSMDVLEFCKNNDLAAVRRLLNNLESKKITVEELQEKFSIQCQDEEYKGTNGVWWLVRHRIYSKQALILLSKLARKKVITSEHLSQPCQGTRYTGVNALFWIVCKYGGPKETSFDNAFRDISGLITEEHLKAQFHGVDTKYYDEFDITQYRGFTVLDVMISKKISDRFIMLLEKETVGDKSKVITSSVLTDRVSDLFNDAHLSAEQANYDLNKTCILAVHMILSTNGRSLNLNHSHSRAANIIQEFDNHILNLLMGVLPPPIRDVTVDTVSGRASDAEGIRRVDDDLFYKLLVNNIFNVKGPKITLWTQSLAILPNSVIPISRLSFFKSYIQQRLLPIAKEQCLEQSKTAFVDNTARLVRSAILDLPGGWKILTKELMDNFKEVMKIALDRFFKENPYSVINRDMQKKITAHIMAAITTELSSNTPKFNANLVVEIILKITAAKKNSADNKAAGETVSAEHAGMGPGPASFF